MTPPYEQYAKLQFIKRLSKTDKHENKSSPLRRLEPFLICGGEFCAVFIISKMVMNRS